MSTTTDINKNKYYLQKIPSDAVQEIKRLDKEGELEIIPITVKDLLEKEKVAV